MRIFEFLTLAAILLTIATLIFARERRSWAVWAGILAIVFTVLHLVLEKPRAQMIPAYVLVVFLMAWSLVRMRKQPSPNPRKKSLLRRIFALLGATLGVLYLLWAFSLPAVFPVYQLPSPTGPYAVGVTSFQLLDKTRPEVFSPDPADSRELLLRVWYPAQAVEGAKPASYWDGAPFYFNHLRLVRTHSAQEAPIAVNESKYPLVVFSHGYFMGFVSQNTALMEQLASHGYVVASIAHPYEAMSVRLSGGRRIPFRQDRFQDMLAASQGEEDITLLMEDSLEIWSADTVFVLDELERINAGTPASPLAGKLDLTQVGIAGMSFGGATAGWVCLVDSRCKAGLNLDGLQFGDWEGQTLAVPFMMLYSETNPGMNDQIYEQTTSTYYRATITGAVHTDMGDMTLMVPLLKRTGIMGPINGDRMLEIINDYTLNFFDMYLKGKEAILLEEPSPFPEVAFVRYQHP